MCSLFDAKPKQTECQRKTKFQTCSCNYKHSQSALMNIDFGMSIAMCLRRSIGKWKLIIRNLEQFLPIAPRFNWPGNRAMHHTLTTYGALDGMLIRLICEEKYGQSNFGSSQCQAFSIKHRLFGNPTEAEPSQVHATNRNPHSRLHTHPERGARGRII